VTEQGDGPGAGQGPGHEVGSLAEEAARLMGLLAGWAEEHVPDVERFAGTASAMGREAHEHVATGAPECSYCPICRAIRLVRDTSPEVREHLAVAAGSLMQAVAGVLATSAEAAGRPGGTVEHIPVTDDWPEETSP
jgi:hypothetical protein